MSSMMGGSGADRAKRRKSIAGSLLFSALAIGIVQAYRWAAAPARLPAPNASAAPGTIALRLVDTPFTNYVGGRKTWSLRAGQIDLARLPGASLANIQAATLTDIRDGRLYESPPPTEETSRVQPVSERSAPDVPRVPGADDPPAATFRADRGEYALGALVATGPDLISNYQVQWQFRLSGNVELKTREGDSLRAEALTIQELINRRTLKPERRILCDSGARVTYKGARVQANQARYDPASRSVECLGGVRGQFKETSVQVERMFWSLREEVIRCPETAYGTSQGSTFRAEGLTIDLKRRKLRAAHAAMQIPVPESEAFSLP